MKTPLAWRSLTYSKAQTALAVAGIGVAVMLMFMQLGFIGMVRESATLIHDYLDYDLLIVSSNLTNFRSSGTVPRTRLYQARGLEGVESARPLYMGSALWLNQASGVKPIIFVMGIDPEDCVVTAADVQPLLPRLRRPDTLIMDKFSGGPNKVYGTFEEGQAVELNGRKMVMAGIYRMGVGMVELGAVIVSDLNFQRLFPEQSLDDVGMGLVKVKPGHPPEAVKQQLLSLLPEDANVLTREDFRQLEQNYLVKETSTGMIFGSGAIVAFVVGMVILYQTLSTQVARYLPQFATLKAIGYSNGYLARVILVQAGILCGVAFFPSLGIATGLYHGLERETGLPMTMTVGRVFFVLFSVLFMAVVAGLLSVRKAYRADPADLF